MKTLMTAALERKNVGRPPVWFMRQAGRYHAHYQNLRKTYSFMELCKTPEVACEATLGPIRDFGFDAAILFSDLLFPLDALGMGLSYPEGPELRWHLKSVEDLSRFVGREQLSDQLEQLAFQGQAMKLIRDALPQDRALLGFVGGPWTLFCYAVEGSHQGSLVSSKVGLYDGRFEGFLEHLSELLVQNMVLQAQSGANAVCVLDTCAGELDPQTFAEVCVPALRRVMQAFKLHCPQTPIIYYAKGTGSDHWKFLKDLPISALGIDWRQDLVRVLEHWGDRWAIQGNIDPTWLFLEEAELVRKLDLFFSSVKALPSQLRQGWICGLGHGVLPKTPESNVRLFLKMQKDYFSEARV